MLKLFSFCLEANHSFFLLFFTGVFFFFAKPVRFYPCNCSQRFYPRSRCVFFFFIFFCCRFEHPKVQCDDNQKYRHHRANKHILPFCFPFSSFSLSPCVVSLLGRSPKNCNKINENILKTVVSDGTIRSRTLRLVKYLICSFI